MRIRVGLVFALLFSAGAVLPAQEVLFGVLRSAGNTGTLVRVDPVTGVCTAVGAFGIGADWCSGLAAAPATRTLVASAGGINGRGDAIYRIDPATGAATLVNLGAAVFKGMADLARNPITGVLYGWRQTGGHHLVTIDESTGAITDFGPNQGGGIQGGGIACEATGNVLWLGRSGVNRMTRFDGNTGALLTGPTPITIVGLVGFGCFTSLARRSDGVMFATWNLPGSRPDNAVDLASYDPATNTATLVAGLTLGGAPVPIDGLAFLDLTPPLPDLPNSREKKKRGCFVETAGGGGSNAAWILCTMLALGLCRIRRTRAR